MAIETATFVGAPLGSNVAVLPHEIPDTQARYIQDGFVDAPGVITQRGPVTPAVAGTSPTIPKPGTGLFGTYRPDNQFRIGVLKTVTAGTNAAPIRFEVIASPFTALGATDVGLGPVPTASPFFFYTDTKPSLDGGVWIGWSKTLNTLNNGQNVQMLNLWHGANKNVYTTGTLSTTDTSTTVTGVGTLWSANLEPGMFLQAPNGASGLILGMIKSIASDTSLELTAPPGITLAGSGYLATPVRQFNFNYRTGRISTSLTSPTVTGSETHFKANITGAGVTWHIVKSSTMQHIGTVSAVNSDTSLTLTANATVALDDEEFVAIPAGLLLGGDTYIGVMRAGYGWLTAAHKGRQFYANCWATPELTTRVSFSEMEDQEALDFDPTVGNFIDVQTSSGPTTPISALASTRQALLICKENESFALYGDTPEQFTLSRLDVNDGALTPMSVQNVDEGVVYAGRNGIYLFDGEGVTNIVEDSLGKYYRDMMAGFDPTTSKMWSMVADGHYFLFLEGVSPTYVPVRGSTPQTVTKLTIAIHMPTKGVTFHTNLDIRGAVQMPVAFKQGTWFLSNTAAGTSRLCSSRDLRTGTGVDTFASLGDVVGPQFYVESKRYDLGDPLRKKLFKEMLLTYLSVGSTLSVDTIVGLNDTGTTSSSTFPLSSLFQTLRIKFLKRSQLFGLRIYSTAAATATSVKLGPWALGFKLQRAGRP